MLLGIKDAEVTMNICGNIIKAANEVKLLGVTFDKKVRLFFAYQTTMQKCQ